ncbi:Histone acetyltransferase [Savitreella phatthalungensis]
MPSTAAATRDVTPASDGGSGVSTPNPSRSFASSIRIGATIWAYAPDKELRRAEVRSLATRGGEPSFYVHFQDFNKRLDEWITTARIDTSKPPEYSKTTDKKKATTAAHPSQSNKAPASAQRPGTGQKHVAQKTIAQKRPKNSRDVTPAPTVKFEDSVAGTPDSSGAGTPRPTREDEEMTDGGVAGGGGDELDLIDQTDHSRGLNADLTKEEEIDNLRTGGSMTQNIHEVSRVKNFDKIQIGKYLVEAWYFSPWPLELTNEPTLYICEFCFSYYGGAKRFSRHKAKCTMHHPPGNEIYRDSAVSFFEIDGRRQRVWCRNLCLLSKAFLDHKFLYFDVDPFLFYCMTTRDEKGHHLIGYFSKEKESADNYNVACILTLPQYQRLGYGRLLIQFSYELSKRENKTGSPEKPLSDLGLLSYRTYWAEMLVDIIMTHAAENPASPHLTIDELSNKTAMTTADVLHTLTNLNMIRYHKGQHVLFVSEECETGWEKWKKKRRRTLDGKAGGLDAWKPPVFTQAQLRFNF